MAAAASPRSKMAAGRPRPLAAERGCGGGGGGGGARCRRCPCGGRGDGGAMLAFVARAAARPYGLLKPTALGKIPGRFLLHQEALPHLPVPPLQQTLDRYLQMLQPIISEEELNHTQELVAEFRKPGGVGERLQKGLERRAKKTENWLSDWWLKTAYLEYRLPVVVHSSPGVVLPKQDFLDRQGQLSIFLK